MSMLLGSLVWKYFNKGEEKILALKLADCANDDGRSIFMKVERMAEECVKGKRTIQRQLRALEEMGWLLIEARPDGGRSLARVYRINPEWIADPRSLREGRLQRPVPAEVADGVQVSGVVSRGAKMAPFIQQANASPMTPSPQKGDMGGMVSASKGCHLEQKTMPTVSPFKAASYIRHPSLPIDQQRGGGFAKFWQMWPETPNKTRRADCQQWWAQHLLEQSSEQILAHVSACIVGSDKATRDGGQYLKGPLTYLRHTEWAEHVPGASAPAASIFGICSCCGTEGVVKRGNRWLCLAAAQERDDE